MIFRFSAPCSSSREARERVSATAFGGLPGTTLASAPRRTLLKGTVSVLALGGCASTLLSACGGDFTGGSGPQEAPTPTLKSVANFRDVGGAIPGYSTSDGAHVTRGLLYRSDVLTPNAAEAATLESMAIACVYDLRTPVESDQTSNVKLTTANQVAINVLGTGAPPSFAGMSAPELDGAMRDWWRQFVTGSVQCAAYGALLERIAASQGPQIICGGTGVDVTGWASALLLLIANVPLEIIVKDFLLTNAYRSIGVDATNAAPPVQASYLQTAFDALQSSYGDLNRYLTAGLGLASATVDQLRSRLVA